MTNSCWNGRAAKEYVMETKLSRRGYLSSLPEVPYPIPSTTHFSSHSFWLNSSVGSMNMQFRQLSERWRNQVNQRSTAPTKHCVHQTRTHVRNAFRTQPMDSNLKHPDTSKATFSLERRTNHSPVLDSEKQQQENASTPDNVSSQTFLSTLNWHSLPQVRTRCHFILLVPLVVFCIRIIAGALHRRVGRELEECPSANKSRRSRWRSVLAEVKEQHTGDIGSKSCRKTIQENEDQEYSEDACHQDYSKLESDYQKFLSECGINKHGYWHGGSSK